MLTPPLTTHGGGKDARRGKLDRTRLVRSRRRTRRDCRRLQGIKRCRRASSGRGRTWEAGAGQGQGGPRLRPDGPAYGPEVREEGSRRTTPQSGKAKWNET